MNATHVVPPLSRTLEADLVRLLGRDAVLSDPDRLLVYESDGLTRYRGRPAAVVLPKDTGQCAAAVALLHGAGVCVVPRGAGTGLSGGAVPEAGAVVVGTARMNRILGLDARTRRARVQAGVVNATLGRAARALGLSYAPDPSSQTACTLGGNVAENSGGPHCLKYGVTSRYVTALTVVGEGGEVLELDRERTAHGALDLVGVFVGSEGCFGLATELEFELTPVPRQARTLLAAFEHAHEAGDAVTAILADGLLPAALEIVDGATIRAVEASIYAAGYPVDAGAALVVEFDGPGPGLDDDLARAAELCRAAAARDVRLASTDEGRAQIWAGRKKAFGAMGRLAPDLLVQDATVPRSALAAVLRRIGEIASRHELLVANVFHAGDGNLHPNLLFDRRDPEQVERVERASSEIMRVCVEAGGTITGEHGVGLDKRAYMRLVCGDDELDAMEAVRAAFDPAGRFNPGKVLPETAGLPPRLSGGARGGGSVAALLAGADLAGVDEAKPTPRVCPTDASELARVVRLASDHGLRLVAAPPVDPTRPPACDDGAPADLCVDLRRLDDIELHDPADFTVSAGAGVRLGDLQNALAVHGQWIAIDGPDADGRMVGDLATVGDAWALARAFGAVRDQVLGLTMVDGHGRTLELGGRVMKNVAGFDLTRLACGSRGRLGVIARVTFRSWPRPRAERFGSLPCASAQELADAADRLLAAPFVPYSLEGGRTSDGALELLLRLGGSPAETAHVAELAERAVGTELLWMGPDEGRTRQRALRASNAWALPDRGAWWGSDRPSPGGARLPQPVSALEARIAHAFDPTGVFAPRPRREGP